MPYTLMKFLVWAIAFFGIGVLVGWLLRALKARGEVAAARRAAVVDDAMGPAAADDVEADAASEHTAADDGVEQDVADERDAATDDHRDHVEEVVQQPADEPSADLPTALDLDEARAVLGAPIQLDDLTVVDGVGPKIAELCAGVGITTWRELADADPATLRAMLDDAGSRFRIHDPTTWSHQAELLADGRWTEFVAYNDELSGDP